MVDRERDLRVGSYRLLARLGSGGMADVFLAINDQVPLPKVAVLKRVRSNLADDPEFRDLLLEEARVSAKLNHPNVVQVLDAGIDDETCYLTMEYLDGQALSALLRRAGERIASDVIVLVIADVLRGLHYAHEAVDFDGTPLAIVHRDLSPQNVFITYDGQVKLLDFGIAKAEGRAVATREGLFRGKVRYMAPEQALGEPVDRRCDIFAAGVLLFQAATRTRFWGTMENHEILDRLATATYPSSPRAAGFDVPLELDAICRRALARPPDDRYATAGEMLAELDGYLGDRVVDLRRDLVGLLRESFDEDRKKKDGLIQELTSSAAIGSSLGAMVIRAKQRPASEVVVLPIPQTAPADVPEPTQSLAKLLEPTAPGARVARRRASFVRFVGALVAVAVLAVVLMATAAIVVLRPPVRPRVAADNGSDRVPISYASDAVTTRSERPREPSPSPQRVAKPTKRRSAPKRRSAHPHRRTKPKTTKTTTAAKSKPASAGTAAPDGLGIDQGDPWR